MGSDKEYPLVQGKGAILETWASVPWAAEVGLWLRNPRSLIPLLSSPPLPRSL